MAKRISFASLSRSEFFFVFFAILYIDTYVLLSLHVYVDLHIISYNNSKTHHAHISIDGVPKAPTKIQYKDLQKLTNLWMLSGLCASFLKGQGHQGIFSLVKATLWGNCEFLLGHFNGTKAMTTGHGGNRLCWLCEVSGLSCTYFYGKRWSVQWAR